MNATTEHGLHNDIETAANDEHARLGCGEMEPELRLIVANCVCHAYLEQPVVDYERISEDEYAAAISAVPAVVLAISQHESIYPWQAAAIITFALCQHRGEELLALFTNADGRSYYLAPTGSILVREGGQFVHSIGHMEGQEGCPGSREDAITCLRKLEALALLT